MKKTIAMILYLFGVELIAISLILLAFHLRRLYFFGDPVTRGALTWLIMSFALCTAVVSIVLYLVKGRGDVRLDVSLFSLPVLFALSETLMVGLFTLLGLFDLSKGYMLFGAFLGLVFASMAASLALSFAVIKLVNGMVKKNRS